MTRFTTVIGLEIHVQLKTVTKLFCGDLAEYGAAPNRHVCAVCLGLPGALPVPNRRAVELGVRSAAALGCRIARVSRFVRKNYFYPDLPKGYQITQYEEPLATGGGLQLSDGSHIRIRRLHLEEDAGKLLHDRLAGSTAIDMNRAGVPLIEIVTEPDIRSPAQARAFLGVLKRTLQYVEVSDCEMEKGTLRVDASVSLVSTGEDRARSARSEVKNLNSFSAVERALGAAVARQIALRTAGGPVADQTLSWSDTTGELRLLRAKEGAAEYRYMDEPDLPALQLDDALIATASPLPELPVQRAQRMVAQYQIRPEHADVLTASRSLADYFEEVVRLTGDVRAAATWTMREVLSVAAGTRTDFPVSPGRLAELLELVHAGVFTQTAARAAFRSMAATGASAHEVAARAGLNTTCDSAQADGWAREIVAAHPDELARLRSGESRILEFFVGQLMRRAAGRLDHRIARDALIRVIQAG